MENATIHIKSRHPHASTQASTHLGRHCKSTTNGWLAFQQEVRVKVKGVWGNPPVTGYPLGMSAFLTVCLHYSWNKDFLRGLGCCPVIRTKGLFSITPDNIGRLLALHLFLQHGLSQPTCPSPELECLSSSRGPLLIYSLFKR